jgi:hypothetical protein
MRDASGDKIALFGELSLEEAMDLSRDRQILENWQMYLNNLNRNILEAFTPIWLYYHK